MRINVNTATAEELKQIPGIGDKVARLIIQFREIYGVVKREALNLALRGNLSLEVLDLIDFSVPKQDPFDIDLRCLPSVPKTDSWEPLVSFAHQSASIRSRSRSPSKPKTGPWQPLTLASELSSSRSPSEPETDIWQPLTLNSPRSRQGSPKSKVSAMLAGSHPIVNAVQSPSEARIEQLTASALKEFATKFQINPQSSSQSSSIETKQISDAKKKNSMQCFFCKKFGHAKKECRAYKAWLSKQQTKANLNDQGLDGKTTHPSPKH